MSEAFVIMQIGNVDLDEVYRTAIEPAIVSAGLTPRRVDVHNVGGLLQNEIASFIERSDIIVADLTNERPNCYLEVGYAIGLGKLRSLVLTARHDHNATGPHHVAHGPKVHFDLSSYDILYWDPADLPAYRRDLEARIRRRLAILDAPTAASPWNDGWIREMRERAMAGLVGDDGR
jgi:hypothetical protein